jgi:L-2,4-diaminobutyric acid acetyltransferase
MGMDIATLRGEPKRHAGPSVSSAGRFVLRPPNVSDGPAVHALIRSCPPLDENSAYCNLLQCGHFAGTCVAAFRESELVGWLSGYRPPEEPATIFVWQVAVGPSARGTGLGDRLLDELLSRPACRDVRWLKTTITAENQASWKLFGRFAERRNAPTAREPWLLEGGHLPAGHATEHLFTIGPFAAAAERL